MSDTRAPTSIVIIEDEAKLAAVLADYLHAAGYVTHSISGGLAAANAVRRLHPDLVLLDLTLPGRDGVEVCREIRAFTDTPIVMVTARVEEVDRLLNALYRDHRVVADRTVDSHVNNLRRKLHQAHAGHELVRSVYGVGYKIEA